MNEKLFSLSCRHRRLSASSWTWSCGWSWSCSWRWPRGWSWPCWLIRSCWLRETWWLSIVNAAISSLFEKHFAWLAAATNRLATRTPEEACSCRWVRKENLSIEVLLKVFLNKKLCSYTIWLIRARIASRSCSCCSGWNWWSWRLILSFTHKFYRMEFLSCFASSSDSLAVPTPDEALTRRWIDKECLLK